MGDSSSWVAVRHQRDWKMSGFSGQQSSLRIILKWSTSGQKGCVWIERDPPIPSMPTIGMAISGASKVTSRTAVMVRIQRGNPYRWLHHWETHDNSKDDIYQGVPCKKVVSFLRTWAALDHWNKLTPTSSSNAVSMHKIWFSAVSVLVWHCPEMLGSKKQQKQYK